MVQNIDFSKQARVIAQYKKAGLYIATAESLTAGLIASHLADIPGASSVLLGGLVAYSNDIKLNILGVSREMLDSKGAVSSLCAEYMALGAKELFGKACPNNIVTIATTGVAGPLPIEDKDPGLVYIALMAGEKVMHYKHNFSGDRDDIRRATTNKCFDHLLEYVNLLNTDYAFSLI